MGPKEILIQEIEEVPDGLVEEVIDFLRFLKCRALQDKLGTTAASGSSLKKDWLLPEEDAAWRDL